MRMIQATEVKTHLAELLRIVERGETIAITRHGKAIAHLIPAEAQEKIQRKRAVEELLRRRDEGEKIKATLEEMLKMASRGAPLLSEVVVDTSIIVPALLDVEHQPIADRVLRHVGEAGGLAPRLWQLETRSALISAERRGRATEARVDELLVVLKATACEN